MIGRIVEIAGDSRYLSLDRGFLVVSHHGQEVGRTPIDDVSALIGNAHGLSYSNNVLVALAQRGCPFVLCGAQHRPVGILWPLEGHHRQAARMDAQINAGKPLRKRLWRQVVRAKLSMQAAVLGLYGLPEPPLRRLVSKVRVGDPSNIEGQGARAYWSLLFGKQFRRDTNAGGCNAQLNYGYAVLRALVARYVIAAGMHPGIPIHHANEGNPLRLVDDLMEPYRPLVDAWVKRLQQRAMVDVDAHVKRTLGLLPTRSVLTPNGISPVSLLVQRTCVSLAQVYERNRSGLHLPEARATTLRTMWDEDAHASGEDGEVA